MATGTVARWNDNRAFGFIELDNDGGDAFIGRRALDRAGLDTLEPGQRLDVEVMLFDKGPAVVKILAVGDVPVANVKRAPPPRSPEWERRLSE